VATQAIKRLKATKTTAKKAATTAAAPMNADDFTALWNHLNAVLKAADGILNDPQVKEYIADNSSGYAGTPLRNAAANVKKAIANVKAVGDDL
jgi:hypothetical protein